jgi:glucose-6-phosphate dehydrogenase assembly protein OpcA
VAFPVSSGVWSAQDTTPDAIETALRRMLMQRAAREPANAPARVLNLVVVVDREWKGEIANRLERVGRYHPSRTVMCAVEPGRTTLDAWTTIVGDVPGHARAVARAREQVEIDVGPGHLRHLNTIVDPVLVSGITTVVWAPHGHPEAVDALLGLATAVLIDSLDEEDSSAALHRAEELARRAYVVDLAWLRSTPWRERIAATFDPPAWRGALGQLSGVTVRHRADSPVAALLLVGWLCSRLGWRPARLSESGATRRGRARSRKGDVAVRLDADATMPVPGLCGVALETASGLRLSLDRGPGGLRARRRTRSGGEREWTVLGASRGEGGILGEGVRQALLRDPTYRPALTAARALAA